MQRVTKRYPLLIGIIVVLSTSGILAATAAESGSGDAPEHKESDKSAVRDWFAKYDQIRRDAELTIGEKLQARGLLERGIQHSEKPGARGKALAHKMVEKYGAAATAMQDLSSLPETTHLQNGYTKFFTKGRELFLDCLGTDDAAPVTGPDIETARKEMEALDKKNKRLDEELRKRFSIPRHRHS